MTGLFIRDILIIIRSFNIVIQVAVITIGLIGAFFIFPAETALYVPIFLPVIGVSLSVELVASDERSGWKKYLPVLPLTRREIVLSKYIFFFIIIVSTLLLSLAYSGLSIMIFRNWTFIEILLSALGGLLFAVLTLVVSVPSGYFFKGQLSTFSMMGVIALIVIFKSTGLITFLLNSNYLFAALIIIGILMILLYCSYYLSLLIYSGKIR